MLYNGLSNNPVERVVITYPFVYWDNVFTENEIDKIVEYCDNIGTNGAKVVTNTNNNDEYNNNIRRSSVMFHNRNSNTDWIFARMNTAILNINSSYYGFDLNGYEMFQYTIYKAEERGTYDWHADSYYGDQILQEPWTQTRKLTITMLLNTPNIDFEGGEFLINVGDQNDAIVTPTKKGRIIAFPSYIIHKVAPITKGIRKSFVACVSGPKFK